MAKAGACVVQAPTPSQSKTATSQADLPQPQDKGAAKRRPAGSIDERQTSRKTAQDNQTCAQPTSELCFRAPRPAAGAETTSAKTFSSNPSLIALARLMGRQAAREWLREGGEGG